MNEKNIYECVSLSHHHKVEICKLNHCKPGNHLYSHFLTLVVLGDTGIAKVWWEFSTI